MENNTIYRYFTPLKNIRRNELKARLIPGSKIQRKPKKPAQVDPCPKKNDSQSKEKIKYSPQVRRRPRKFFDPENIPFELRTSANMKKMGLSKSPRQVKSPQKNPITTYFSPTKREIIKEEHLLSVKESTEDVIEILSDDDNAISLEDIKSMESTINLHFTEATTPQLNMLTPSNTGNKKGRRVLSLKKFNKKRASQPTTSIKSPKEPRLSTETNSERPQNTNIHTIRRNLLIPMNQALPPVDNPSLKLKGSQSQPIEIEDSLPSQWNSELSKIEESRALPSTSSYVDKTEECLLLGDLQTSSCSNLAINPLSQSCDERMEFHQLVGNARRGSNSVKDSIDWEDMVDTEISQPFKKRSPVKPKLSPLLPIITVPEFILKENITEGIIHFLICSAPSSLAWSTFLNVKEYLDIATAFCSLDSMEQRLYARLFSRKNSWIKIGNIEYKGLEEGDTLMILDNLVKAGFVTNDYSREDIVDLLNLMGLDHVRQLCKIQNIDSKGNKGDMIKRIKSAISSQNTLVASKMSMESIYRNRMAEYLGHCFKLTAGPRKLFDQLALLATYPYFYGEEKERLNDLNRRLNALKWGSTSYPKYKYKACPVFHSLSQFEEYHLSVQITSDLLLVIENKDWDLATQLALKIKDKFESVLKNSLELSWIRSMPRYLIKFTAANKYTYALTKGLSALKKDPNKTQDLISALKLLLSQRDFRKKNRGFWYNELALVYQTRLKDVKQAGIVVLEGLQDPDVSEVWKMDLTSRASTLIKRKKNGLTPEDKAALNAVLLPPKFAPQTLYIQARSAPNVTSGRKQVFVRNISEGKEYSSVEDVAIAYYRETMNFQEGRHDEGRIILNLALCLFWDIIYYDIEDMPENECLFHSPMQTVPLDWGSRPFYHRRKHKIEAFLDEMRAGGVGAIVVKLEQIITEWNNTEGAVEWRSIFQDASTLKSFLECIKVECFLSIARHLMSNYTAYRSGFPDLTLWDPPTARLAIVEVKGPSDTLSAKQIIWLENLRKFGVDAHVCRVNTLNTGKRKLSDDQPQLTEDLK